MFKTIKKWEIRNSYKFYTHDRLDRKTILQPPMKFKIYNNVYDIYKTTSLGLIFMYMNVNVFHLYSISRYTYKNC